jgi:hypothetical protein
VADSLHAPRRRHRVWPWVLGIFLLLLAGMAALAAGGVALAAEALDVRDELEAAKSELAAVPELVKAGDTAQFEQAADGVLAHTSSADEIVQGPLWSFASAVPFVGQNIAAMRDVTEATHILVRDALPPSFGVLSAEQADKIRFEGGGFNLEALRGALAALPAIDEAFTAAQQKVEGIDRSGLLPIVDEAIGQVLDVIVDTAPLVHSATEVLPTAMQMLGETEPRTYFVMFQNNAEIRATGGNPAAGVLLRVEGGRVSLVGQTGSAEFAAGGVGGRQYVELPPETLALYFRDFPLYSQNYTRTPNFPTTASLFQGLVAATRGQAVDGVISLDPVALSHMLAVAGPVTVDGVEINAGNAVSVLLNETYWRFPAEQEPADAFFAAASAAIFDKLVAGSWDPLLMMDATRASIAEQRVYGWFTREPEQAIARELGIDGAMKTDNAQTTEVGIFLNDHGVSKMEYYLSTSVAVDCNVEARTVTTSITMTNSVDRDDLTYTIGSLRAPTYGAPRTSMMLDVLYFAPPGATIDGVDPARGDVARFDRSSTEGGRSAKSVAVFVDKGETRTVSYTSTLPEGELGPLSVRYSPTVTTTAATIAPSCAALTGDPVE